MPQHKRRRYRNNIALQLQDWELYKNLTRKVVKGCMNIPHKGAMVHISSRRGLYIVVKSSNSIVKVTCGVWQDQHIRGQRKSAYMDVSIADIKFAGGIWNLNRY